MLEVFDLFWRPLATYECVDDCSVCTGLTFDEIRRSVLDTVAVRGFIVQISKSLLWKLIRREISNRQGNLGLKQIAVLEGESEETLNTRLDRVKQKLRRDPRMIRMYADYREGE